MSGAQNRRNARVAVAFLAAIVVLGSLIYSIIWILSDDKTSPEPSVPAGAVQINDTIPAEVEGLSITAGNFWDDSAQVTAYDPDTDEKKSQRLEIGESIEVSGHRITMVTIYISSETSDRTPGSSKSWAAVEFE